MVGEVKQWVEFEWAVKVSGGGVKWARSQESEGRKGCCSRNGQCCTESWPCVGHVYGHAGTTPPSESHTTRCRVYSCCKTGGFEAGSLWNWHISYGILVMASRRAVFGIGWSSKWWRKAVPRRLWLRRNGRVAVRLGDRRRVHRSLHPHLMCLYRCRHTYPSTCKCQYTRPYPCLYRCLHTCLWTVVPV